MLENKNKQECNLARKSVPVCGKMGGLPQQKSHVVGASNHLSEWCNQKLEGKGREGGGGKGGRKRG